MKRYFLQALMYLILYAAALSCFYYGTLLQPNSLMGGAAIVLTIIFLSLGTHVLLVFYDKSHYKFFYEWGKKISLKIWGNNTGGKK